MTEDQLNHLLRAIIRLEHGTTNSMHPEEYEATAALARKVAAPDFIVQYFDNKVIETKE